MDAPGSSAPAPPAPPRRASRRGLRLAIAVAAFLVVRGLLLEVYVVHGTSMEPTLHADDRVLVWKPASDLKRGDLVVFAHPDDASRVLVKRVVALPGERVAIRRGQVFVDDRELGEPYLSRDRPPPAPRDDRPEQLLPPGHYFVLGDNRDNSQDSRTFGALGGERVLGRALVVAWPPRTFH